MSQTKAQLIDNLVQALNFTGTSSAPANGLFLSASNQLKLATASTERLKIDGTEVVVNDTGASVDFRIEGDTEANLLFVDASADRAGIGTSSPDAVFHIFDNPDHGNDRAALKVEAFRPKIRLQDRSTSAHSAEVLCDGNALRFNISVPSNDTTNLEERMRLDSSGRLLIGHSSSRTVGDRTHLIQIEGTELQDGGLSMVRNRNDEHSTSITLAKSRGAADGAVTILHSGDSIGEFAFAGADGNDVVTRAARIHCEVDGTPGTDDMPGRLKFSTTEDGAASPSTRMTIKNDGKVGIGTDSPTVLLHLSASDPRIKLTDTDGPLDTNIINSSGDLILDSPSVHRDVIISSVGVTNEIARFTGDGKVGIGTGNPQRLLSIVDSSGAIAEITTNTSGNTSALYLHEGSVGSTSNGGAILYDGANNKLAISCGTTLTTERVTIDRDNGDVTINQNLKTNNLPGRNLLINGAMQVNQRVGSPNLGYFNPVTAAVYTLDRWRVVIGSGFDTDSAHITKSSTSPAGFGASMRWEIGNTETPSANQNCGIEQKIEAQNLQGLAYGTSSAKTMTLSFHVYSNKTGTYCVQIMQEDGSKYQMHEYTINSSNTWEKKTITIVGNTSNAINNDTGIGLRIIWMLTVGSGDHVAASSTWVSGGDLAATSNQVNLWDNGNNNWYLTGCQLEVGTIATEFEHIDFGNELRSCQRYFFNVKGDNQHRTGIPGYANSTSSLRAMVNFPTAMRDSPTFNGSATAMVFDAADDSASFNCNTLSQAGTLTNPSPHMMMIETSTSSMTSGQAGTLEFRAANGFLEFSAEL